MTRKKKRDTKQGTYAFAITMGLVLGFGLGITFDQLLLTSLVGAAVGFFVARRLNA